MYLLDCTGPGVVDSDLLVLAGGGKLAAVVVPAHVLHHVGQVHLQELRTVIQVPDVQLAVQTCRQEKISNKKELLRQKKKICYLSSSLSI